MFSWSTTILIRATLASVWRKKKLVFCKFINNPVCIALLYIYISFFVKGIQEDSGLSEFSDIEETKLSRENQSSINKQNIKYCTDNSVPMSSEIDSCRTADVNMVSILFEY